MPARAKRLAQAVDLARNGGDPAALPAALSARHVALSHAEHTTERLQTATEMLEVARRAGDRELALQARNWRVVDLFELGDGARVQAELHAYAALAVHVRLPSYSWYVATLAALAGRLDEGRELASAAAPRPQIRRRERRRVLSDPPLSPTSSAGSQPPSASIAQPISCTPMRRGATSVPGRPSGSYATYAAMPSSCSRTATPTAPISCASTLPHWPVPQSSGEWLN